jgi:hypothetical protein
MKNAIGTQGALCGRMVAARQRAAALLRQTLIDCERDASAGIWGGTGDGTVALRWEREKVEQAIELLCTSRPVRLSQEEKAWARDAGEQLGTERKMLREHLELCR